MCFSTNDLTKKNIYLDFGEAGEHDRNGRQGFMKENACGLE